MANPAVGSQFLSGFARERVGQQGVPDPAEPVIWHKAVPPAALDLPRGEEASPEVNASGFPERGLPSAVGDADLDFAFLMTASGMLEPLENLLGGFTKEELITSKVWRYIGVQDPTGVETSLRFLTAKPPTQDKGHLFGGKVASITHDIAQNAAIAARFAVRALHATRLETPQADGGNTGTYDQGPYLRGPIGARPRNRIHIQVASIAPLQVLAEMTDGVPTYPGSPQAVAAVDGRGEWFDLQGALKLTGTVSVGAASAAVTGTGTRFLEELRVGHRVTIAGETHEVQAIASDTALTLATNHAAGASNVDAHVLDVDLGFWAENRDPLQAIFPGMVATDWTNLVVGDQFVSEPPGAWTDPVPTFFAGQRFTSAHWFVDYRRIGAATWISFPVQSGQIVHSRPVSSDFGNASRYPSSIDRDGASEYTVQLPRKLRDTVFVDLLEAHERLELRLRFEGRLLDPGGSQWRESLIYQYPSVRINEAPRPVSGPGPVIETLNLVAETNEAGDPPMTATVITDRDWDLAVAA